MLNPVVPLYLVCWHRFQVPCGRKSFWCYIKTRWSCSYLESLCAVMEVTFCGWYSSSLAFYLSVDACYNLYSWDSKLQLPWVLFCMPYSCAMFIFLESLLFSGSQSYQRCKYTCGFEVLCSLSEILISQVNVLRQIIKFRNHFLGSPPPKIISCIIA